MNICFSANASFTVGVALLAIGAFTIRRAGAPIELPYAAIPLIFGMQQLVEGGLWLELPTPGPASQVLTIVYLLFSNVLWPIFVPVAVWLIEPGGGRRRWIACSIAAGAVTSLFFLINIILHPVSAAIKTMHIAYHLPHPHDKIAIAFYAAATCLAPLLSSHRLVRLFGAVLVGSMIASYLFFTLWFASVWCFFAAILSVIVFLYYSGCRKARIEEFIIPAD